MFRHTPEFLCWSLEYSCPVRGLETGRDPERAERQLRAARAVELAQREARVFEGLCLDPPNGFRIADALEVYGGLPVVEAACANCPANATAHPSGMRLAGCCGLVPVPDGSVLHEAADQAIEMLQLSARVDQQLLATRPRWYGLWAQSPLSASQAAIVRQILAAVVTAHPEFAGSLTDLSLAAGAAASHGLALYVSAYPRGGVERKWWWLVRHCPRCKASWLDDAAHRCAICNYAGRPAPIRKRHARGMRPYFPLDRLLGREQAAELLIRYAAYRAGRQLPDQAENRPPPTPPDSLPAD